MILTVKELFTYLQRFLSYEIITVFTHYFKLG